MPKTLKDYLAHLDANPNTEPVSQFPARVAPAEKPPKYYDDWPWGDIVVYPDWLVFLSLQEDKSGPPWRKFLSEFYEELKPLLTLKRWATNPETILIDIAAELANDEDVVGKALTNSHSLFVPFDEVRDVTTGNNWNQGHFITVRTLERTIVICQDSNREMNEQWFGAWRVMAGWFKSKWKPELVEQLCRHRHG